MPVTLTTPIDVGALDDADYEKVKVIRFVMDIEHNRMEMTVQYGNMVGDPAVWVPGDKKDRIIHIVADTHDVDGTPITNYTDYIIANAQLYTDVKTAVYNKLVADGIIAGTIDS